MNVCLHLIRLEIKKQKDILKSLEILDYIVYLKILFPPVKVICTSDDASIRFHHLHTTSKVILGPL